MVRNRRHFSRPLGARRYRKLFVIATEGQKTEPQYLSLLNSQNAMIHVECLRGRSRSAPPQVLQRMNERLRQRGLKPTDEAWLVIDKDNWTDTQLDDLHRWTQQQDNYHLALSNPQFEFWLLLHFDAGSGVSSAQDCTQKLRRCLPDYQKHIDARKFTSDRIQDAVDRAKQKDTPPCNDWPRLTGTTVYRLVENILNA